MKTQLNQQEITWIMEQRVKRLSDQHEVLIYPMGAERYLSAVLSGKEKGRYAIKEAVCGKQLLIIPGYANNAFLFAKAGAKSVTVYDKDPVTIAWLKAFKKYYHYREGNYPSVGELLTALTAWYPPCLTLPQQHYHSRILWLLNPQALRQTYLFYLLSLIRNAVQAQAKHLELEEDIQFHAGDISELSTTKKSFDMAYVPYLLGVQHGIENEQDIVQFMEQLLALVKGPILITPCRHTKEFYCLGKRYFTTTAYAELKDIPALRSYLVAEDKTWFRTQGLSVFSAKG
jgi:hypothetical protein